MKITPEVLDSVIGFITSEIGFLDDQEKTALKELLAHDDDFTTGDLAAVIMSPAEEFTFERETPAVRTLVRVCNKKLLSPNAAFDWVDFQAGVTLSTSDTDLRLKVAYLATVAFRIVIDKRLELYRGDRPYREISATYSVH